MDVVLLAAIITTVCCLSLLVSTLIFLKLKRSKYGEKTSKQQQEILVNEKIAVALNDIVNQAIVQPLLQEGKDNSKNIGVDDKNVNSNLYFTLKYDEKRSNLLVKLVKGENIPVHRSFPSKPYIEVFVVPANASPTRSGEGLQFHIGPEELFRQTIHFCIYRYNVFSRKITIGDVFVSLAELRANNVTLTNEVFLKNSVEPSIEFNIQGERNAKDLWGKLKNAVHSGKFIHQVKRQLFIERLEWETGSDDVMISEKSHIGKNIVLRSHQRKESVKEDLPLGKLIFSLKFDEKRSSLLIKILKATDIPDDNGLPPNTMIECSIFSGTDSLVKPFTTNIQYSTFTPVFEEMIDVDVNIEDVWKLKIRFMVWYVDTHSQAMVLGEVAYSLSSLDTEGFNIAETAMLCSETIMHLDETPESNSEDEPSQILFSLTYLPATNRLVVLILKAKDLKTTKECYAVHVEVLVLHRKLRYRKSTSFKTEKNNPVFNEALFFDLKDAIIDEVKLQLIVYQKETTITSPAIPLGKLNLGKDNSGSEQSHWTEALTAAKPTAQWHDLQPVQYVKPRVQSISPMKTKDIRPSFLLPKSRR